MRLTHFGHSCLLADVDGTRLLFDPGVFSHGFEGITDLDAILITHQHPDHVDRDRVAALVEANPQAKLFADPQTALGAVLAAGFVRRSLGPAGHAPSYGTAATLRAVAARAGVSAALVLHHFGSKEGLRAACDEHLLADPPAGWPGAAPGTAPTTVLSYESLPHEPPTAGVNAALQSAGHRVLVPITLADMQLEWCDLDDPGRTPFGIDAPTGADLVLAPGLAVDRDGTRLGQGGGCYDRVLPMLAPHVPVVVLLHPGELADEALPREPHDVSVGWVLSALGCGPVAPDGTTR